MRSDWLWDRKMSARRAKKILKDPESREFFVLAPLLLARKNDPKEVFGEYLDPLVFCRNWFAIKKKMRQDRWTEPRIIFWQAIYEHLIDKYRKAGMAFRKSAKAYGDTLYEEVGKKISAARKKERLSQEALADKIGVSQQLVSRIERGGENLSLGTLRNVSRALNKKLGIEFT